jgi:5-methylcytosine-specific restriction enzyme subunit McrC
MNLLWEEFIYRQLKKVQNEGFQVSRQQQKPFWQRRYLRPDILLKFADKNVVIDTKWKVLKRVSPSMEDLRQMYVYHQYFNTEKSVLIYPKVHDLKDLPAIAFDKNKEGETYFCQVNFVDILKNGALNRTLGKDIFKKINP